MRPGRIVQCLSCLLAVFFCAIANASGVPKITKVDPPDWWANMPKPMLLIEGENLSGGRFSLSDPSIRVEKTQISENGHWAEVWLSASPTQPKTVSLRVKTQDGETSQPYRFAQRRGAGDGMAGFSSRDALYLIMTDRFVDGDRGNDGVNANAQETSSDAAAEREKPRGWHGGDIKGIIQHLDYIQKTGFTAVWLTPVYANEGEPDSYHGYGATDMYGVDPHYGSLSDLQVLASELHRRHMKLVLDTVPNHVGPKHPWVDDEPDPAWLHGTKANHHKPDYDFRTLVDPHAPWRDQQFVLQGWFADVLPDLNQENPATAQYLIQNAIWWIEKTGADGLRIDTFPYVGRAFWRDFHTQVHALFPQVTTVGEVFNCDATITSAFAGGVTRNGVDTGLDTPFDFPSECALRDVFLKDQPMTRLAEVWGLDALYPHPERLVPFLGNHDISRFLSTAGGSAEKTRMAFAVLLTMRGMPQVYSGDEIGMTGGDDPDNRHDFPGGWPGASQNTFDGRTPEQSAIYDWVQQLLGLRARFAPLQTGAMQVLSAQMDQLAYVRYLSGEAVLVVVNRSASAASIQIDLNGTVLSSATKARTLLGEATPLFDKGSLSLKLGGTGVWIAAVN